VRWESDSLPGMFDSLVADRMLEMETGSFVNSLARLILFFFVITAAN